MPRINPSILRWARQTAGLGPEEAAKKISLRDTQRASAESRLAELERGETEPSRSLLIRMAKQYRRPLVAFYMEEPPHRGERGQDFRTLPADHAEADEVVLDVLIREALARQSVLRAAIEDDDNPTPVAFIGSASADAGVAALVETLRGELELPLAEFRSAADAESAFRLLRERVEGLGAFVVLLGNLGSHHTSLDLETFRGLALADSIAPFIVINDQDSRAAWSFSLLHELTHLFLGQTGVSGGSPDQGIERLCNEVAAEFLLPSNELRGLFERQAPQPDTLEDWIAALSERARVSRTMIAYQLFNKGLISRQQWSALQASYRAHWLAAVERKRERAREESRGPNFYVVKRHRLGTALLGTTARLMASGALTTVKAARVLGVKPTQLDSLFGERVRSSRSA